MSQEATDRGSANLKPACDVGFAAALPVQLSSFDGFVNHRWWPAEAFASLPGMGQTGTDTLSKDLPFELGEHGEQAGHRAARGGGQVKCFCQRYESDSEMLKFLERRYQVCDGPAPAIQTPHQDDIDFAPTCGSDQSCSQLALRSAGADLLDLRNDFPAALERVLAHGANLQRQRLLVVCGNASVQANPKGVAKTPAGVCLWGSLFFGHSRSVATPGRKLTFPARKDSSYYAAAGVASRASVS